MWLTQFAELFYGLLKSTDRDDKFASPGCLTGQQLREVQKKMLNAPFASLTHLRDCDECYDTLFRELTPAKRVILQKLQQRLKETG